MKKSSKARSLMMLTALAAIIILAAGWFLLVSPVLSGASEANAQAEAQEQANENTQIEVNKLRQQYAQIDEYQADLDALQVQIPTTPKYAELQQMFADVAADHHVVITSLQFGTAVEVKQEVPASEPDPSASATPEPTASADASGDGSTGDTPKGITGLFGIPVSLTVQGAYDDVMSTLKELQTTVDSRIVLVTSVQLGEASASGPQASDDPSVDTAGVFGGQVFVLEDPNADKVDEATDPSASPSPSPTN